MGGGIGVISGVGAGGRRGVWRYYRWDRIVVVGVIVWVGAGNIGGK